ncbi:MAG TPA: asparagine synthase-related protein [Pyrinomonadaceae bacterium]|nr:asparagine synthase-related protein [Pyrinomonadaceae bacterium]
MANELTITANARLDARDDLNRSDAELILDAYEKWGDDCVKHLLGDFAFTIWDGRRQRYFCARDHFGVKPFYFTHINNEFAFSSSLNELRPLVSNTLNEIAVGDYLLFGVNQDLSTTIFKDIQRLKPGHTLTVDNGSIAVRPYWTPEPSTEVRYRDPLSYVEHFSELLARAVKDRVTEDRVAISMSGGLDSTSLAALAHEQGKEVHGFAVVYDSLIPDEERHYSSLAAQHLGIPVTHLSADRYSLFDEQVPGDMDQPEPFQLSALTGQFNDLLRLAADFSTVALTGYDGDAFMNVPQRSRLGGVKKRIKQLIPGKRAATEGRPYSWLDEAFAKRTHLVERWERPSIEQASPLNPIWTALFEGYDRSSTKLNLEVRHPFMDVRLVEFLSSIPVRPWRVNKQILRAAMNDKLPSAVVTRRKTPLAGDPALQLVRRGSVRCLDSFEVSPQLRTFVNLNRRRSVADEETSDGLWANLRIFALNYWLTNSQPGVRRTSQTQVTTVAATKTSNA